jgi:hypothetical protein
MVSEVYVAVNVVCVSSIEVSVMVCGGCDSDRVSVSVNRESVSVNRESVSVSRLSVVTVLKTEVCRTVETPVLVVMKVIVSEMTVVTVELSVVQ